MILHSSKKEYLNFLNRSMGFRIVREASVILKNEWNLSVTLTAGINTCLFLKAIPPAHTNQPFFLGKYNFSFLYDK